MAYDALPSVSDETREWITQSYIPELTGLLEDMRGALERIDDEIEGLAEQNDNLARLTHGVVEGLYGVFANVLPGEILRAHLRIFGYYNALVLLRALDMELRRQRQP